MRLIDDIRGFNAKELASLNRKAAAVHEQVKALAGYDVSAADVIAGLQAGGYEAAKAGCGCAYERFCGGEEMISVRLRKVAVIFDPSDGEYVTAYRVRR